MNLQDWVKNIVLEDKMLFKGSFSYQIKNVVDICQELMPNENAWEAIEVYSTHRSKSINLPVFYFKIGEAKIWMRDNFYDLNVSVDSPKPVMGDMSSIFSDDAYGYCYAQGMEDKKFSPYKENNQRFTVCLNNYDNFKHLLLAVRGLHEYL